MGTDPTADDIATIRTRTAGCAWMTDADLTTMIGSVLCVDGVTPDLWAISAMVLEQYQINQLLNPNVNATQVQAGDNSISWATGNQTHIDSVIGRYWYRACPNNRQQYLSPRIRHFHASPSHRPNLLRRWWGVYPVVNGYPGADLLTGDYALEQQTLDDWSPLLLQENDL